MHGSLLPIYTTVIILSSTILQKENDLFFAKASPVVEEVQEQYVEEKDNGDQHHQKDAVEKHHAIQLENKQKTVKASIYGNPARNKGLAHTPIRTAAVSGRRGIIRNPKSISKEENASSTLKLDSISLVDRWHWILSKSVSNDSEYDHNHDQVYTAYHQHTPFAAQLLMYQYEHPHQNAKGGSGSGSSSSSSHHYHPHHHSHSHHHHKHGQIGRGGGAPTSTLYSVSWSVVLSTLTIMTMTCITTLSSLVYRNLPPNPSISHYWEHLSQIIPTLLSSEYEVAEKVKTYIHERFLPKSLQTMEKMILMEIWRAFWMNTFRLMRTSFYYIFGESYYDSVWETYAPGWLRRGVRSMFVKKVQGRLQSVLYGWITKGWEVVSIGFGYGWWDFEMVQDGHSGDGGSIIIEEKNDGASGGDGSGESEGHPVELLDDVDMELEMEFEDGSVSSGEDENDDDFIENNDDEDNVIGSNDGEDDFIGINDEEEDFIENKDDGDNFDDFSSYQEDVDVNDDGLMTDDSAICPDNEEC